MAPKTPRRRRVVRVGAAYAAVAFVAAQVADIVLPALELPAGSMRLVLGLLAGAFPVVVAAAWFLDLNRAEARRGGEPAGPDPPSLPHRLLGVTPGGIAAAAAVAVLALGSSLAWALRTVDPPPPSLDPELVAVLPFRVSSDPPLAYLDEGMMDLVAASVSGAGGLRTVESRRVLGAWRQLEAGGVGGVGGSDRDHALEVARMLGAGRLLTGGVVGHPDVLVITGELREAAQGRVLSHGRVEGSLESLGVLADRLGWRLLAVGEGEGEDRVASLSQVPASSLRLYLEGRRAYRSGTYGEAADRYAAALRQDSTFVLAALGILHVYGWVDVPPAVVTRSTRLVSRERERLSPLDRLHVDEVLGPAFPGATSGRDLVEAARRLAEAAPDRAEGWYRYGDRLLHLGTASGIPDAHARALRAFDRAIALDSTFSVPLLHRMEYALAAGDTGTVLRLARGPGARARGGISADQLQWLTALARGSASELDAFRGRVERSEVQDLAYVIHTAQVGPFDLETAERAARTLERTALTAGERWDAMSEVRVLERNRGRPSRGDVALSAGLQWAPDPLGSAGWVRRIEDALFWDGKPEDGDEALARLVPLEATPEHPGSLDALQEVRCWAEQWRLHRGDDAQTEESVRRIAAHGENPRSPGAFARLCTLLLEAVAADLRGRPDAPDRLEALDALLRTAPPVPTALLHGANLTAARLFEAQGDRERALAAVRRRYHLYWHPAPVFLSTMLREEGRLALLVGDPEGAGRAYRHFLALRSDPEPELRREVDEVRAILGPTEHDATEGPQRGRRTRLAHRRANQSNPRFRRRATSTKDQSSPGSVPIRSASRLSMVAIFAGLTTEGTGRPTDRKSSAIETSPGRPRFAALVIITTQRGSCPSPTGPRETTRAGRCCRASRSV